MSLEDWTARATLLYAALIGAVVVGCSSRAVAQPALEPASGYSVTLDADEGELDPESNAIRFEGGLRAYLSAPGATPDRAVLRAPHATYDLQTKAIAADGGVSLVTEQGLLQARSLSVGTRGSGFGVDDGAAVYQVRPPADGGRALRVYLRGDRIAQDGADLAVTNGWLSTIGSDRPDLLLRARSIRYRQAAGRIDLRGVRARVMGLELPGYQGTLSLDVAAGGLGGGLAIPFPSYSGLDGLYVPLSISLLTSPDGRLGSQADLRLGSRGGVRGAVRVGYELDSRSDLSVTASRREREYDDLRHGLLVSREPELAVTRRCALGAGTLVASASIGRLRERARIGEGDEDAPAQYTEAAHSRAALAVTYSGGPVRQPGGTGLEYGASLLDAWYGGGDRYTDLAVRVAVRGRLGPRTSASAALVHHLLDGETPFGLDRVVVRSELRPTLTCGLGPVWSVGGWVRYDLSAGQSRDYLARLSRSTGAATWHLTYRQRDGEIGLGVDLNGLTGGTSPPAQDAPIDRAFEAGLQDLAAGPDAPRPGGEPPR